FRCLHHYHPIRPADSHPHAYPSCSSRSVEPLVECSNRIESLGARVGYSVDRILLKICRKQKHLGAYTNSPINPSFYTADSKSHYQSNPDKVSLISRGRPALSSHCHPYPQQLPDLVAGHIALLLLFDPYAITP